MWLNILHPVITTTCLTVLLTKTNIKSYFVVFYSFYCSFIVFTYSFLYLLSAVKHFGTPKWIVVKGCMNKVHLHHNSWLSAPTCNHLFKCSHWFYLHVLGSPVLLSQYSVVTPWFGNISSLVLLYQVTKYHQSLRFSHMWVYYQQYLFCQDETKLSKSSVGCLKSCWEGKG